MAELRAASAEQDVLLSEEAYRSAAEFYARRRRKDEVSGDRSPRKRRRAQTRRQRPTAGALRRALRKS